MGQHRLLACTVPLVAAWVFSAACSQATLPEAATTPKIDADMPVGPQVDQRAPDFTLEDLTGQAVSLGQYRGRPVLLNFFATWCTPCLKELPHLQAAHQREQDSGLAVLLVNLQEDRPTVQRFANRLGLTARILTDPSGDVFYEAYRVVGLPATFFIDRSGVVRARFLQPIEEPDLAAGLAAIK
ncbi:MAG: TlpA family protein disulfide reductase [Chloroflexi bacterium]|nr:TlpA family protein disulfide reductase [Chloroflexota bacterium]